MNCWLKHTQTALDTQSKYRAHSLMHYIYSFWNILVYTGSDPIGKLKQSKFSKIKAETSFVGPCGFSSLVTQAGDRRHWVQYSQRKRTREPFFAVMETMRSKMEVAHLCCCCLCFFIVPLRSCSVYGTSRLCVVLFWIGLQFNVGQDELHWHDEWGVWISAHGRLVLTWNNKKHSGRMWQPMLF